MKFPQDWRRILFLIYAGDTRTKEGGVVSGGFKAMCDQIEEWLLASGWTPVSK